MKNTISINSGKLEIIEKQKLTTYWLKFMFAVLAIQAVLYWGKYYRTQDNYNLLIAIFMTLIVTIFTIRELFFQTYKKIITINEIQQVSIQKIIFEKDKVCLKIKLKRKTRDIMLNKKDAEAIKSELERIGPGTIHFN